MQMKLLLVLGSILTLTNLAHANSCPQLAGSYINCTTGDVLADKIFGVSPTLNISQDADSEGAVRFTISDPKNSQILIDGKEVLNQEELDEDTTMIVTSLSSCNQDTLSTKFLLKELIFKDPQTPVEIKNFMNKMVKEVIDGTKYSYKKVNGQLVHESIDGMQVELTVKCDIAK